jgi:hypothetical protein
MSENMRHSSVSGLFHLTQWPPVPSMLLQMTEFHFYGWVIFHCVYIPYFFIHSSINEHSFDSVSWLLWIFTVMSMEMKVSLWYNGFISFGYISSSGIGGSLGSSVFSF